MEGPKFIWDLKVKNGDCKKCNKKSSDGDESCTGSKETYCLVDNILCCSDCRSEDHPNCQAITSRIVRGELKKVIPEVENIVEQCKKKLDKLKDGFGSNIKELEENKKALKLFEKEIMCEVQNSLKIEIKDIGNGYEILIKDNNEQLKKAENVTSSYIKNAERLTQLGTDTNIIKLMSNYMELKEMFENLNKDKDIEDLERSYEIKKADKEMATRDYKELPVFSKLKVVLEDISGQRTETISIQSDSEYLYSFIPLASYIHAFNIRTKVSSIHNLTEKGKEMFKIPYGAGSLMYDNRFIVAGGSLSFLEHLSLCYEYSIFLNKLVKREDMIEKRSNFAMVKLNEKIYAIGGENNESYLSSCETMCFTQSLKHSSPAYTWTKLTDLNWKRAGASACVVGECIYVLGGVSIMTADEQKDLTLKDTVEKPSIVTRVEKLDPSGANSWEDIAIITNLTIKGFSSIGFKGLIYVFGGVNSEENNLNEVHVLQLENLIESKEKELKKLELSGLEEPKGFELFAPRNESGTNNIWLMGKSKIHYLNLDNPKSPKWNTVSEYPKLNI